jgi:hypothetical protein
MYLATARLPSAPAQFSMAVNAVSCCGTTCCCIRNVATGLSLRPISRSMVPWTAIVEQPAQKVEVASACCSVAGFLIPLALRSPKPLADVQVATLCCIFHSTLVKSYTLLLQSLQHVQGSNSSSSCSSACADSTTAAMQPLHLLEVSCVSSLVTNLWMQRAACLDKIGQHI